MDYVRQLLRSWLESGEATAEEARQRRVAALQEKAPAPAQLMRQMAVDPVRIATELAGESPELTQDLTMTESGGWSWLPESWRQPTTRTYHAGELDPRYTDKAAEVAMSIPLAGVGSSAGRAAISGEMPRLAEGVTAGGVPITKANQDQLIQWLQTPGNYTGGWKLTTQDFINSPSLAALHAQNMLQQPDVWSKELESAFPYSNISQQELEDLVKQQGAAAPPGIDPFAQVPFDPSAFPTQAASAAPPLAAKPPLLDRNDPEFPQIREELYRRGLSQDPIVELQEGKLSPEMAQGISDYLRGLLAKPFAEWPSDIIAPHGIDTARFGYDTNKINPAMERLLAKVPDENWEMARSTGFNMNPMLYRGTRTPTDQFMDPRYKDFESGLFFADNPVIGSAYGSRVYPVLTRAKNPAEVDFGGADYGSHGYGPWGSGDVGYHIKNAQQAGHDMLIIRNMDDLYPGQPMGRGPQDQYVVFDPALLRSPFAKFDPQQLHRSGLLRAQVGGINPFAGEAPDPQDLQTKLDPIGENLFQAWKAQNAPMDSGFDYDLRGAYKAGLQPDARTHHWDDQFKLPNHPTFSDLSQYAPYGSPGHWFGDVYAPANPFPWLPQRRF